MNEAKSLPHQYAAHKSWGNTENRTARTASARQALEDRFLDEAGGDPVRAASIRKAFYSQLTLRSVQARARRKNRQTVVAERIAELAGGENVTT